MKLPLPRDRGFRNVAEYLVCEHIQLDHTLLDVKERLAAGAWPEAAALFRRFQRRFERHMEIEERLVFPRVTAIANVDPSIEDRLREDHQRLRELMRRAGQRLEAHDQPAYRAIEEAL